MSQASKWVTDCLADLYDYVTADLEDAERARDDAYARVLELRGAVKALRALDTDSLPNRPTED